MATSSFRRTFLLHCLVGLFLFLTALGCTASSLTPLAQAHASALSADKTRGLTGGRAPIDTWTNIHSFLTFDYRLPNPGSVASRYDFVWGATPANVPALRANNPNIFLTYYVPFHRDFGAYSSGGVPASLSSWQSVHPDWVLYQCDRKTPAYEYHMPNVSLDFSNPSVLAWQVATYALPASVAGYDGIAADNVDLQNSFGACGTYQNGVWVQRYSGQPNDPQWSADVLTWLTQMQSALHSLPRPLALIPNLSGLSPSDALMPQVLAHIDGVLDEAGFTSWGSKRLATAQWLQTIAFMRAVQQLSLPYYSINLLSSVNTSGVQWALASYLMAKEHSAALFIGNSRQYGSDAWHSEYAAQIGSPTDEMYLSQNVYWRDYSGGLSLVNPSPSPYTISLTPGVHYVDLYGNAMGATVTLAPHSGMVLLLGA